jgi:hypothetical protein
MTTCIIESPYAGDVPRNRAYLQRCIRWCIANGMTPYASHQMLTEALDGLDPAQRAQGIAAGVAMATAMIKHAKALHLYFVDHGVSRGMAEALPASKHAEHRRFAILLDGLRGDIPDGWIRTDVRADNWGAHLRIFDSLVHPAQLQIHDATADTWGPR